MRISLIIISYLFTIASIYILIVKEFSLQTIGIFLFFGLALLTFIFKNRIHDWRKNHNQKLREARFCILKEHHFLFPKGYHFQYGFLAKRKILPYKVIDEIRTNTHPITAKIKGNELIFLFGLKKEAVQEIAIEKNIRLTQPQDNWSLLCNQYLDTEFDETWKANTKQLLIAVGISEVDQANIDKRIKSSMLIQTFFSWEWVYYGQYDVLNVLRPLNKKKYWWTMDIALKES